jgi:hypothetical protein
MQGVVNPLFKVIDVVRNEVCHVSTWSDSRRTQRDSIPEHRQATTQIHTPEIFLSVAWPQSDAR